jgi:hypothetical protein
LVEFVGDFSGQWVLGQSKNSRPRTATGGESSKSKRSLIKMKSKFGLAKSCIYRIMQRQNVHPRRFGFVQEFNGNFIYFNFVNVVSHKETEWTMSCLAVTRVFV